MIISEHICALEKEIAALENQLKDCTIKRKLMCIEDIIEDKDKVIKYFL